MNSIVDGLKPENKKWLKAGGDCIMFDFNSCFDFYAFE